jgi:hypothetical protein
MVRKILFKQGVLHLDCILYNTVTIFVFERIIFIQPLNNIEVFENLDKFIEG